MKFTLSWLKDHLDTSASLEEISRTLTVIGLEVESITNHAETLKDFVVAEILEAAPHPDANKLQYCDVTDGTQVFKIVCGAPNARKGLKTVLAREGVYIPGGDFTIKKTKIRGLESCGMLCSAEELALGEESDGIIELAQDAVAGSSAAAALGMDDPVIEIAITPNRGDCLGVRGVARDLAAAGLGVLKPLVVEQEQGHFKPTRDITIEATENCFKFIGCEIRGVKNGASPEWLQRRLKAIGLRPISALVDITNYLNFNLGRPSHVYDLAKVNGNITVRHAKQGEQLLALNGKTYELAAGQLVIADENAPLGIAGIIGGEDSSCSDTTTDVLLEVALFNPDSIARTGRALQIDSDARYRFERNVDPAGCATGAELAVRMITAICGGEVSEWVVTGAQPQWQRHISFRPARVASLGGVDVPHDAQKAILQHLGFHVTATAETEWDVVPPSFRADVEGEADVVEEILRIHGYDHIPATPLPAVEANPALTFGEKTAYISRRLLAGRGFAEICSWAFMDERKAKHFGAINPRLRLANPIASDLNYMRPSIVPNLLDAANKNKARGIHNAQLFEVGTVFSGILPNEQPIVATALRTGTTGPKEVHQPPRTFDVFDAKADALSILEAAGMDVSKVQVKAEAPAYYHPGRSGTLCLGPKVVLGYFGELHPLALQHMDFKGRAVAAEVFIDRVPQPKAKGTAKPLLHLSPFQSVERDFAFLTDGTVTASDVLKAIRASDQQLIKEARIFDVYKGKGVEDGKQSIAVSVVMQAADRTLTDEEIQTVSKKITEAAQKSFGGVVR